MGWTALCIRHFEQVPTKAGKLYLSSLSVLHKSSEVLRWFCVDAWEAPSHPHLNTSKANQSKWHGQGGLRRKECCLSNALLATVVLQLNIPVSINHCLKFLYMCYQPVTSLFALTPYLSGISRSEKNSACVFLQQYKHHFSLASAACFPVGCWSPG